MALSSSADELLRRLDNRLIQVIGNLEAEGEAMLRQRKRQTTTEELGRLYTQLATAFEHLRAGLESAREALTEDPEG